MRHRCRLQMEARSQCLLGNDERHSTSYARSWPCALVKSSWSDEIQQAGLLRCAKANLGRSDFSLVNDRMYSLVLANAGGAVHRKAFLVLQDSEGYDSYK